MVIPEKEEIIQNNESLKDAVQQIRQKLKKAIIHKKIEEPVGVLFSGGVDSVLVSVILKDLGIDFKAYFGYVKRKNEPKDLSSARFSANLLVDINLHEGFVYDDELEEVLPDIIKTTKTTDPVQIGVAVPLYIALREAKDDNIKTLFCGSGADELFCGYNKFNLISKDYYKKSIELLNKIKKRDLLRDKRLAKRFEVKLFSPFINDEVIAYGLSLKDSFKKTTSRNKIIVRELLKEYGLPKEVYDLKKKAAQYGSNSEKALTKLMKASGFKTKQEYFLHLKNKKPKRYGCLFSGGKDSNLALFLSKKKDIDVCCLLSVLPKDDFSYMYQRPKKNILELQSEALDIPILYKKTNGVKEKELKDLEILIKKAIINYRIEGIVTGALFSNYQKKRIETICKKLNITCFSPLWHMSQEKEMSILLDNNFRFIFDKIAAYGLTKEWLGKTITNQDFIKLKEITKKYKINIAGEGGEFESVVLDSPLFNKKINIIEKKIKMINDNCGVLDIKKATLVDK